MSIKKYFTSTPIIATLVLSIASYVGVVYAIDTWNTGYQINVGQTKDVYSVSDSKQVYHGGGVAGLFIPTKTAGEWSSFVTNKPAGVTVCHVNTGDSCSCDQLAYSCQPAPGTPDPAWCTSPNQYVWSYNLDWTWSPATCGTYSAYVRCVEDFGGTMNCAGQCMDNNYPWLECGTFMYNSPLP